jgi:hypothetical protein
VELALPPEDKGMLVGLREAVRGVNDEETERLTVPWKPPIEVTVTVGVEEPPCGTLMGDGLTVTVKSDVGADTVTVMVVDLVVKLLLPVTITEYWPVAMLELAEICRVDVPEMVMLLGLRVAVRPEGAVAVKLAIPANPTVLVTVIVEIVEKPWATLSEGGVLLRVNRN